MKLFKDTTLRAMLKGIYIMIDFDSNGIIKDYQEIDTDYLKNVSLDTIKLLTKGAKATTTGKYKAVLTIGRDEASSVYRYFDDFQLTFKEIISKCLIDSDLRKYVRLVMYGNYDNDIDTYNEMYECDLCKYFSAFYRTPKLKLNVDIDVDDLKTIIAHWINNYYFDTILLNGKTQYSLYSLASEIKINPDEIGWKGNTPYYLLNGGKQFISITDLAITENYQLANSSIYMINNNYIGNSLKDKILKKDVNKQ